MKHAGMPALIAKSILIGALIVLLSSATGFGTDSDYWPDETWRVSTPETQGMRSDVLADMVESILASEGAIDSITVIRNGYRVLDIYFYPFQKDSMHIIHSCTKSIMSTLIGIALDKGIIKDVNQGLLDFFPEYSPSNMTMPKKKITLENVLTMSTGFDSRDSYKHRWVGLVRMRKSDDWTKHMLDLPMKEEPGVLFEYSNGNTYLLSAILQKRTGIRSLEFAKANLFKPLGIKEVRWETNARGIDVGYGRMWLKPHDMAKFGWLFLKKGIWKEKKIVSEKWVKMATTGYLDATIFDRYGFQWWVDKDGWYAAVGYGGQRIFVVPEHDLVAVFTSTRAFTRPDRLMRYHIIKSVDSDPPLIPAPKSAARLKNLIEKAGRPPKPSPVPELPSLAKAISGKTFEIETSKAGFTDFTLIFEKGKNEATLKYGIGMKRYNLAMGLDGIYRITQFGHEKRALKGEWVNDDTFRFSSVNVGHTESIVGRIKFIDNEAHITMPGRGGAILNLKGIRK